MVCAGGEVTGCTAQREAHRVAVRRSPSRRLHQPLHAGFAEDRGGSSVDVRFNGRKENLHSLWDTALVELEEGAASEVAARIEKGVSEDERKQWQGRAPEQWAL